MLVFYIKGMCREGKNFMDIKILIVMLNKIIECRKIIMLEIFLKWNKIVSE